MSFKGLIRKGDLILAVRNSDVFKAATYSLEMIMSVKHNYKLLILI